MTPTRQDFEALSELMRVIDAYAFDYKEQGKLGPSRRAVELAIQAADKAATERERERAAKVWLPIESAPKDGTPIIIADIGDGHVYDVVNGYFEVLTEDEEDGPWSLDGGEPHCSYVGRAEGAYFCSWLCGKELDQRWLVHDNFPYTHWMPRPTAPDAAAIRAGERGTE